MDLQVLCEQFPHVDASICKAVLESAGGDIVKAGELLVEMGMNGENERDLMKRKETEGEKRKEFPSLVFCPYCFRELVATDLEEHSRTVHSVEYFENLEAERQVRVKKQKSSSSPMASATMMERREDFQRKDSDNGAVRALKTEDSRSNISGGGGGAAAAAAAACSSSSSTSYPPGDRDLAIVLRGGQGPGRALCCLDSLRRFPTQSSDRGWGCGYRNLQVLISSLACYDVLRRQMFARDGIVPEIPQLQTWLESAWRQNLDPVSCQQLGGKVVGTRKWIGACEGCIMLQQFGIAAATVAFQKKRQPSGDMVAVLEWVWRYFSGKRDVDERQVQQREGVKSVNDVLCGKGSNAASRPPLFLQWTGHSVSILGAERGDDSKSISLLILDPSWKTDSAKSGGKNSKKKKSAAQKKGGGGDKRRIVAPVRPFWPPSATANLGGNFVSAACRGCYPIHFDSPLILGVQPFDEEEFGVAAEMMPEVCIEPESGMLSVFNKSEATARSFFITVTHPARANDVLLEMGESRDEEGRIIKCITFVLLVQPFHVMDICFLEIEEDAELDLYSDISDYIPPLAVDDAVVPERVYRFPLGGDGPFQCTQGCGGHFTHFFRHTRHAIDFGCPVGTPVLAIANGKVVEVRQDNNVSGIHGRNLYLWNSILLELDDGNFVEYVHIRQGSVKVAVGERVTEGQVLCESGDVGFCPSPHLHIQMHASGDKNAVTIPFSFRAEAKTPPPLLHKDESGSNGSSNTNNNDNDNDDGGGPAGEENEEEEASKCAGLDGCWPRASRWYCGQRE